LFQASLLNSKRHGNLSVRGGLSPWADSLKFALPPGEDCTAEHVREVRLAAAESVPQQQQVLRAAIAAAENIERAFAGVPGGIKPKLALLMGVLKGAAAVLDDTVSAEETTGVDAQSGKAAALPGGRATGPVSSREDAVRKLIEAAEYFRRHEPSSPIPLLVDRVRRLAGMNFLALVEELGLGDQALQEFRKLAGVRETPEKTEAAAPSSSG
jgi:type VI secretion system protein ImpA